MELFKVGDIVWHKNNKYWVQIMEIRNTGYNRFSIREGWVSTNGEFEPTHEAWDYYGSNPDYWDLSKQPPTFKSKRGNRRD